MAWLDVGSMDGDASGVPVEVESDAIVVSALASLPLGERFSLFGKLGYAVYDTTAEAHIGNQIVRDTEDDEDLLYGAGVNLDLGEHFALRLEYETVDVSAGSFDMTSLSAIFRF